MLTDERPIIFSAPMVRALLEGRKTMTRRLAWRYWTDSVGCPRHSSTIWQRVKPGDRFWVKENFYRTDDGDNECAVYAADTQEVARHINEIGQIAARHGLGVAWQKPHLRLRPSIHMPRWASRLTLIVTAAKVEPLQDISESDAIREGLINNGDHTYPLWTAGEGFKEHLEFPRAAFEELWVRLHGAQSWASNPEVVALTFTVHHSNIDTLQVAA